MNDKKDSLDGLLSKMNGRPGVERDVPPEADGEELSIGQMSGDYSRMRPSNRAIPRIHVVHKDGKVETLYYHHMDAKSVYDGASFTFVFAGAKVWELTVEGRNLWRLYDYMSLSRWPYLRVATRDFEQAGEVVTAVRVKDITPREPA